MVQLYTSVGDNLFVSVNIIFISLKSFPIEFILCEKLVRIISFFILSLFQQSFY